MLHKYAKKGAQKERFISENTKKTERKIGSAKREIRAQNAQRMQRVFAAI